MKIYGPPGFPIERYVRKLLDRRMGNDYEPGDPDAEDNAEEDAQWRRDVCTYSPILFGLTYCPEHLTLPGGGVPIIALSEFHIELAMSAKRWARTDIGPKEIRDAWVAPRAAAKSTWLFLILTTWALAYGHRKFIVVYGDTEAGVRGHLRSLKLELTQNELLRADFPDLCTPLKANGRAVLNTTDGYLAANGSAIMVKGMNSATLGVKLRERRPDAIFGDDIEPKEGNYSIEQKNKRLTDLIEAIFPCNVDAVVQLCGTTVMHSSIVHDMIQGKDWVSSQNIRVHHFQGIIEDAETGEERSLWPQRWSLDYLRSERLNNKRSFGKNFANQPIALDGTYWDDDDITYDESLTRHITDRVLVVDPAAKSRKSNDETGIGMIGWIADREMAVVERVMGVRLKPTETRELVHSIVRNNGIKLIVVDTTNGGDHVLNTLDPLPVGVKIRSVHLRRSKADRFSTLHDRYQRRQVVHTRVIPGVEAQMKSYPNTLTDDRIDVVCLGVEHYHGELPRSDR